MVSLTQPITTMKDTSAKRMLDNPSLEILPLDIIA